MSLILPKFCLQAKTVFITGSSRGIGAAIARECAKYGANVVITGKSDVAQEKLPGTIHTVAAEVTSLGGRALALKLDVRDEVAIAAAMEQAANHFGGIDILINNAGAIFLASIDKTPMKRFDLVNQINTRATFATVQACLPYLQQSNNPHILNMSPPLNMDAKWFADKIAYTISKYGMSMCTLGLAQELKNKNIAVNSLWPKTTIATSAVAVNFPKEILQASRKDIIVAEAAAYIITQNSIACTGNFFLDEEVLRAAGVSDFSVYAYGDAGKLVKDFYVE
jgi:citronellol/citronellal dehydrogenase